MCSHCSSCFPLLVSAALSPLSPRLLATAGLGAGRRRRCFGVGKRCGGTLIRGPLGCFLGNWSRGSGFVAFLEAFFSRRGFWGGIFFRRASRRGWRASERVSILCFKAFFVHQFQ